MVMVVRAYPLRAGMHALKEFGQSLLAGRRKETDDFFRRHGVSHESWHVQRLGDEDWVICCTQLRDKRATEESYGASTHEFDTWFKSQVLELCGIDPNATPLGLPSEQVFSWDDAKRVTPII